MFPTGARDNVDKLIGALIVPSDTLHARIAGDTLPLANRIAWRAICQALGNAGVRPGRGFAAAAREVWAERKALLRMARAEREARP